MRIGEEKKIISLKPGQTGISKKMATDITPRDLIGSSTCINTDDLQRQIADLQKKAKEVSAGGIRLKETEGVTLRELEKLIEGKNPVDAETVTALGGHLPGVAFECYLEAA